ncbi:MAG: YdiU family protein, partial [Alphaproteobacteria bacterium]|nr:YdiU family protein [Alphaproteobacteria bacterium]
MFGLKLENHYARLPGEFYTLMPAEKVGVQPRLLHANPQAAALLGMDPAAFSDPAFTQVFSGHAPLDGFTPLAMVYSGHQFGVWAGQLGDGRALLIGQARNPAGELWDIQLKGAGQTPYSRFADGRAVMRSTIREYLCSEALAALGIPSTRALAIIATNEQVHRETAEPGAVLTRLARSHVRFGHFEHFF